MRDWGAGSLGFDSEGNPLFQVSISNAKLDTKIVGVYEDLYWTLGFYYERVLNQSNSNPIC